jgi:aldehyde dehydrogenase (NAD+)
MPYPFLKKLGIEKHNTGGFAGKWFAHGEDLDVFTPIDGSQIATVTQCTAKDYAKASVTAKEAFEYWREIPAPKRGEVVRQLGEELREHKQELGSLVSLEMGKILPEGMGEVQEMIDICDFAVGLSRQLYGLTIASERPKHFMMEQWHPLGTVGIISAFNFPVAVWAWNAALAAVCGDSMIWKPASKTPLTAIAVTKIAERVLRRNGVPLALMSLAIGPGATVGEAMLKDDRVKLLSLTGSSRVGHHAAQVIAGRFGKTILELGGNNAIIVTASANMDLAVRGILFGAVGTTGQRCTSTRRIIAHRSVKSKLVAALEKAYRQVPIGNPLKAGTLMGPLVSKQAVEDMMAAIEQVKAEGGKVICGGKRLSGKAYPGGCYVTPCLMEVKRQLPMVCEETFAPILYVMSYDKLDEAIAMHNAVPQGLSSAIFTKDLLEAQRFLSATGSDCGIANVNIGTSGAEIGGAFGGEKETGGGRESGSDAWKAYMRRQTNTVNWSTDLPLAQGIKFG